MRKIAQTESALDFGENNIAVVELEDRIICVARYEGNLYAFPRQCPHAGGPLNEGWIDAQGNVACPVHGYKFGLKTGRHPADGGYLLRRWRVEKREDGIYAAIP